MRLNVNRGSLGRECAELVAEEINEERKVAAAQRVLSAADLLWQDRRNDQRRSCSERGTISAGTRPRGKGPELFPSHIPRRDGRSRA